MIKMLFAKLFNKKLQYFKVGKNHRLLILKERGTAIELESATVDTVILSYDGPKPDIMQLELEPKDDI